MTKNKMVKNFIKTLNENGEMYFSQGDYKKDYDYITSVLKTQGFWAGIYNRFYFDENLNLIDVKERWEK